LQRRKFPKHRNPLQTRRKPPLPPTTKANLPPRAKPSSPPEAETAPETCIIPQAIANNKETAAEANDRSQPGTPCHAKAGSIRSNDATGLQNFTKRKSR
jgi:hypothetical protein